MKKLLFVFLLLSFFSLSAIAQNSTISGVITDADTDEPLIGAAVFTEGSTGTVTDFDGNYSLTLKNGKHLVKVSYVSYETKEVEVDLEEDVVLNIKLGGDNLLNEVVVTADIAIERETPVAFTNIPTKKIAEELGAQDIPMILNSTPGAYATESGGGDGDARISIRGFDQRNVAVMLDGIPVNDMENGRVFWSNWFGLDLVTQTMQVQRGLGASKLSIPSIGGTINILTKGIDAKRGLKFKQEVGNNGFTRSTIGLTSGRLKNGFGVSAAASYKQGDGWVDGNFTRGFFYYLRIDKQLGNHMISLSGFGAPQEHGQRAFTQEIGTVDSVYAVEQGVPDSVFSELENVNMGRKFNEFWGYKDGELLNTRKNFYHKPQFSLRHSWQVNQKVFWSNVAYLSIGKGGGTATEGAGFDRLETGELDIDGAVIDNMPVEGTANSRGKSSTILRASNNEHFWYGILSTLNYQITPELMFSGGIDARYYRGDHYRSVYDLLGGNYYVNTENNYRAVPKSEIIEGDKFGYDNSGFVKWGGVFGLLEYKRDRVSVFANVSTALTSYSMVDYMKPKIVELADTSFLVGYQLDPSNRNSDTTFYNDVAYTLNSPEAKDQQTDWIDIPSYTFKVGASFKINEGNSIFFNTGYISKAQRFNNVINNNRFDLEPKVFNNYDNEEILAFELGYSYKSTIFSANLNSYYTKWNNKPLDFPPTVPVGNAEDLEDEERVPININGINALHKGIELDFAFKPIKEITIEGLASIGDWRWTSGETALVQVRDTTITYQFDATDVLVGDAAQLQFGGLIRYEPIKSLYFKIKGTYFAKNYSNFQPEDLQAENGGRQSWQLPNYAIYSFHAGYGFTIDKVRMNVRANVLNLFDKVYISDARNNDDFGDGGDSGFNARSATVHFGQGRRFTISLQVNL